MPSVPSPSASRSPVLVAWRRVQARWCHVDGRGRLLHDLVSAVRRYWHFANNLLGGFLSSTVEIWLAAVILTAADLSLFSGAHRLSILLAIPLVSLGVVFSPVVSRLEGGDRARLERLLRTGATMATITTAAVWVPMLVAPGPILGLVYGDGFAAGAPILLLLTVGGLAYVVSGMAGTALTMSRHEQVVATVQWVAVVLVHRSRSRRWTGVRSGRARTASAALLKTLLYVALWAIARRRMRLWTHPTLRPSLRLIRQTSG